MVGDGGGWEPFRIVTNAPTDWVAWSPPAGPLGERSLPQIRALLDAGDLVASFFEADAHAFLAGVVGGTGGEEVDLGGGLL